MRGFRLRETLSSSLWFIPLLCVLGAFALFFVVGSVDRRVTEWDWPFVFKGSPEGAHELLGAIVSSIITFTAVVFSLTIVAIQLASQQFSPRVLRTFLRDRQTQVTLGLFIATLTFSVLVLREVRLATDQQSEFVPRLSVMVALVILGASLAMFVSYLHHTAQSVRVVNIIKAVADETRAAIDALLPEEADEPRTVDRTALPEPSHVVRNERHGVVVAVGYEKLARRAARHDLVIEVVPVIGDFLPRGVPLLNVYGAGSVGDDELREAVGLGSERTMRQDPAFGFRQIVDVAVRALSPSINDPTTAVQCLDQLHDLLRTMATRPARSGELRDDEGTVRVLISQTTWSGYLSLALDEIRHAGVAQPQIARRMRALLDDLLAAAPPESRGPVREQLENLAAAIGRAYADSAYERALVSTGDVQGIGGADRDGARHPDAIMP